MILILRNTEVVYKSLSMHQRLRRDTEPVVMVHEKMYEENNENCILEICLRKPRVINF